MWKIENFIVDFRKNLLLLIKFKLKSNSNLSIRNHPSVTTDYYKKMSIRKSKHDLYIHYNYTTYLYKNKYIEKNTKGVFIYFYFIVWEEFEMF